MTARLFDLAIADLGPEALAVARFSGTERVGRPFRFTITFGAAPGVLGPPEALLAAAARLEVHDASGAARRIQGVVARVALRGFEAGDELGWYDMELVPRFALARKRRQSRVFQDLAVPDIAALLLEEHGVRFERRLATQYERRTYCVQYQETDFAFVTRLLAEEGIFYWFEDPPEGSGLDAGELLVLGDTAEGYRDLEGEAVLHHRGATGLREGGATTDRFQTESVVAPTAA